MKTTYSARPGCTGAHTSRLARPGNEKALHYNGFLRKFCAVRVPYGPATDEPYCPGVTNDSRIARPVGANISGSTLNPNSVIFYV